MCTQLYKYDTCDYEVHIALNESFIFIIAL